MKRIDDAPTLAKADARGQRWPSRILLSVPQERLRAQAAALLLDDGYEIAEAASGAQTLEYLHLVAQCRFRLPDVIVLAAWLHDVSAIEVGRAVRKADWPTPLLFWGQVPSVLIEDLHPTRTLQAAGDLGELRAAVIEAHVLSSASRAS